MTIGNKDVPLYVSQDPFTVQKARLDEGGRIGLPEQRAHFASETNTGTLSEGSGGENSGSTIGEIRGTVDPFMFKNNRELIIVDFWVESRRSTDFGAQMQSQGWSSGVKMSDNHGSAH